MKDSILLIDIYKRYLEITSDLVEILERNYKEVNNGIKLKEKIKREEFIKHAQRAISNFHNDLHILFKLSWELKDLEK